MQLNDTERDPIANAAQHDQPQRSHPASRDEGSDQMVMNSLTARN